MKILLSGASSFSGFWFARELAMRGHEVVAVFRGGGEGDYSGVRRRRVELLAGFCHRVFGCVFGDAAFMSLVGEKNQGWDLFCHHAAAVGDFRAPGYDVSAALAANTRNLPKVLALLREGGCDALVLTGSVFESGEGKGSDGLPAILPYGLAKSLTWQSFLFYARECRMRLGKFVIANPFGPMEEDNRFTSHLARQWLLGEAAVVRTPDYVRDNIHISLLAAAYADYAERFGAEKGEDVFRPSGYVEKQGLFAQRFAAEMRERWKLPCKLNFAEQQKFDEPMIRVNTDNLDAAALNWREDAAWDGIAGYYQNGNIAV